MRAELWGGGQSGGHHTDSFLYRPKAEPRAAPCVSGVSVSVGVSVQ